MLDIDILSKDHPMVALETVSTVLWPHVLEADRT